MCVPGCAEAVQAFVSRRRFLAALSGDAALAVSACARPSVPSAGGGEPSPNRSISYARMEDLSHTLSPEFPTFGGKPMNSLKRTTTLKKDGFNTFTWNLFEHIGTHIDAPVHFSENGVTVDQIPASRLVAPLAVIDVPARASENSDTTVTVDDLLKWESTHGRLPEKRVVAMQSGWSEFSPTQRFRNADPKGGIHFPGFHAEAARFLIEERSVIGIAVDTLSLDPGNSKDFAVHANWLSSGRWGIECLANLQALPAHGATIVVGAPKIAGATGGPSRVFAFVP